MATPDLSTLLITGTDDELLLFTLSRRISNASNEAQRTFCTVWEAAEFLPSDGFESLLEQATPLEEYAAAYARIGMPQIAPLFDRVLALIPPELRSPEKEEARFRHIHGLFEKLKQLLYEYLDSTADLLPTMAQYVREHRSDFTAYFEGPPPVA